MANSVDTDETPRSAASHLGLYCLLMPVCPNIYGKYGSSGVLWFYVGGLCVHLLYICPSVFSLLDDNLDNCQWIFTKLGMCSDIGEVWFRIANGQILSIF